MEKESKTGCIEQLRTKCGCERAAQDKKTLRDEFAMAALSGYMATGLCFNGESAEWAVTNSYKIADAMLAAAPKFGEEK